MNEDDQIVQELKYIKLLLAHSYLAEFQKQDDKIIFLSKYGFDRNEIAEILETTPNTVSVALSRAKPKSKKVKKMDHAAKVKTDDTFRTKKDAS